MKKTHKKMFGLFGLVLVVAVTVFAAFLPGPKTQAVNQVVDTITVRVVGATPAINISGIDPGSNIISGSQEINVAYENIEGLSAVIKYIDADGNQYEQTLLDNLPVDYVVGVSNIELNLETGVYSYTYQYYDATDETIKEGSGSAPLEHYGYGEYTLTVSGDDLNGVPVEKSLDFTFAPFIADVTQDGSNVTIDLEYEADDGSGSGTGKVATIIINLYDEDGNPVGPSPVEIIPPTDTYSFDMSDYGLPTGTYTISIQAYDADGNALYKPYTKQIYYEAESVPVPDTGGIMGNLNISKTDYIITGLMIFSIVGISGAVFVSKHDKKARNGKRR